MWVLGPLGKYRGRLSGSYGLGLGFGFRFEGLGFRVEGLGSSVGYLKGSKNRDA